MTTRTRFLGWLMWHVSWHPPKRSAAWVMTSAWFVALLFPLTSVALNPERGLDLSYWAGWSNMLCGALDLFFLYCSIHGLLWIYTEGKSSPGRGSTGE